MLSLAQTLQDIIKKINNFKSLLTGENDGKYVAIQDNNNFKATSLFLKCGAADTDNDISATKNNTAIDLRNTKNDTYPHYTYLFNPDTKHFFYYEMPGSYTKLF